MTTESEAAAARSYGCTFGCGNPYDYILVDVMGGETLFLCVPCFISQAVNMVEAFTNPESEDSRRAMEHAIATAGDHAPGPTGRKRGHNAPAASDDTGLFEAYDAVITTEELPPEFR